MKRQKIRKTIILVSFFLFPITIFYFSPVTIVVGARLGIINGSFITFTLLLLTSLFLGRAFCGWVCPGGGIQEACFIANDRKSKGGRYNWIKYFIWVPWISIIVFFAIKAHGYHTIDPFLQTTHGISVAHPVDYVPFYIIVGLITILAFTTGKRGFCHYACWVAPFMVTGTKIRTFFKWPALRLTSDKEKCTSCKKCSTICNMSLDVMNMVQRGSMEDSECILCGICVEVCPKSVIKYVIKG